MEAVLVVEDDPEAQALVRRALSGLRLRFAGDLESARQVIAQTPELCLILLDLGLPDGDGLALCTELAAGGGMQVPVIVLTASEDSRDVVTAFSLGAEDYVRKPFVPLELRARVTSRLERWRAQATQREPILVVGCFEIDLERMRTYRCVEGRREEIALTPKEQQLLRALAERPGRLLSREHLLSVVWDGAIVGHRTVDTHVSNLRSKLGSALEIEGVRGLGYRICTGLAVESAPPEPGEVAGVKKS